MGSVVCATRAGEHSRRVHKAAFERIASTEDSVVFVHVLGGQAFDAQPEPMRRAIHAEVGWLVETLVRLAQQQSGVDSNRVRTVIVEGEISSELIDFIRVIGTDHLVMGRPRPESVSTFSGEVFDEFLRTAGELGVAVDLIETSE